MPIDKPKRPGCKCPQGEVNPECYHHGEKRKAERQRNTSKGGYMKEYYKRNREAEAHKAHLIEVANLVKKKELDVANAVAIKGLYSEVKDYIRLQGELHRQYVILPDLMEAECGDSGDA